MFTAPLEPRTKLPPQGPAGSQVAFGARDKPWLSLTQSSLCPWDRGGEVSILVKKNIFELKVGWPPLTASLRGLMTSFPVQVASVSANYTKSSVITFGKLDPREKELISFF